MPMDPLSVSASIVALLEFTEKIIQYAKDVYQFSKERQNFLDGLQAIRSIAKRLDDRLHKARQSDTWYDGLRDLVATSGKFTDDGRYISDPINKSAGPLARLYKIMAQLLAELMPSDPADRLKRISQRLTWHWDKVKFEGYLKELVRCRDDVNFVLDQDHFALSKAIKEDTTDTNRQVKEIHARMSAMEANQLGVQDRQRRDEAELEKAAIEKWLSPLEFLGRQDELSGQAFPTGQWLIDSTPFKQWVQGKPWHLRCYGPAGSGKTMLSSLVIGHLQQNWETPDTPVVCMYLDYKDATNQTLVNLMGSLLKQLVQLRDSAFVSNDLRDLYRKAKRRSAKPRLEQVRQLLLAEIATYDRVYCVVDALDECSFRQELLSEILKLVPEKLSLLITSRQIDSESQSYSFNCDICGSTGNVIYYHCDICNNQDFDLCIKCKEKNLWCEDRSHTLSEPNDSVQIDIRTPDAELERYIQWEINKEINDYGSKSWDTRTFSIRPGMTRFGRKCQKDPELLRRIPAVVVQKANGRFLYAKLFMDSLKSKQTLRHIQDTLDDFPDEVNDIYDGILRRISEQKIAADRTLGLKTLSLIACAHRPLSLAELQQVLSVEPGATVFDQYLDYDQEEILSSTAGLVTVDGDKNAVRLIHTTLQEYFNQGDNRNRWFPRAEVEMAGACLTYLNFDDFSTLGEREEDFDAKKEEFPFLAYASQYWGVHVHDVGFDPEIQAAAVELIQEPRRMAAYIRAAWYIDQGSASWDVRKEVDGLHVCAWFGLSSVIPALDPAELDVDVQESTYGQTPLMYACRAGHLEMVQELLNMGASINIVSARGRTALFEAILHNHEQIVDFLLTRGDLDINAVNTKEHNRTALLLAVRLDHVNIAASLLERDDININQPDSSGITALYLAAFKNNIPIVRLLLEKPEIDVNRGDSMSGRSPLIIAAERNHTAVVELLFERGADPMIRDRQGGGTALLRAADYGCISVIETMLASNVNLHCRDADERTILHGACAHGRLDVVRFLTAKGLDLNARDKNGLTPLHEACCEGQIEVVKLLLEIGAERSPKDHFRRTPFICAWQHGNLPIMRILEPDDDDEENSPKTLPNPERLPTWSLAKLGFLDLVKKVCTERDTEVSEVEPCSGNTALHWAVLAKHDDMLRLLLQSSKLSPNSISAHRRTPLHLAASQGNLGATQELLKCDLELDLEDEWGATPLYLAQSNYQMDVAVALVEAGAQIDADKIDSQALFFAAIELNNVPAADALIKRGRADVLCRNNEGMTPLQFAKANDNGEMIQLLRSSKSFYHKVEEKEGRQSSSSSIKELMALPSPKDWGIDIPVLTKPIAIPS